MCEILVGRVFMDMFPGVFAESPIAPDRRSLSDRLVDEFYLRLARVATPLGLVVLVAGGLYTLVNNGDLTAFNPRGATFRR